MPSYLLDTCAWLDYLLRPEILSGKTQSVIESQEFFHVSSISLVEVSRKNAAGDLDLSMPLAEWMGLATVPDLFGLLDITVPIAIDAFALPGDFHKDLADRLIVATARVHQHIIITSDKKILDYPHVRTLKSR